MSVLSRTPSPLIDKRNALVFLAALALMCGGALENKYLLALGEIYAVIVALGYWRSRGAFDSLRAERLHYPRTFERCHVEVLLRLETARRAPIHLMEVFDCFPPAADEYAVHLVRVPFSAEGPYEIHYAKTCVRRRGPYQIGPLRLRCSDPMGLFPQMTTLPLFTPLLVYPQAQPLPQLAVLGEGTLFHVGQQTTRRSGQSEEFVGLRDYRPGDPPQRVHWPSSARHGRLIVKEFQETVTTDVDIFLDLSRLSHTGIGDQTSTEWMIRAAASVAARAIELSHLVELRAIGKAMDHVPLAGGQQQLITILDRLAVCRADGQDFFHEKIGAWTGLLRRGATAIFICGAATLDLETAENLVRLLALQSIRVVWILVDERQFIRLMKGQDILLAKAPPMELILTRLRLAGSEAITLTGGDVSCELENESGTVYP
ncbi:MAG: DUF58 domain-containing protein [Candidatus Sumerlaeota bacterium]|nr:DUF58 domain-containing protein [Candidatus Sumerlaeota bacterium]